MGSMPLKVEDGTLKVKKKNKYKYDSSDSDHIMELIQVR